MSRHAAARAIREHSARAARLSRNVHRGTVIDLSPLRVELMASDEVLELDEDFDISMTLATHLTGSPLAVGDVLLLMREHGEWTAFDGVRGA